MQSSCAFSASSKALRGLFYSDFDVFDGAVPKYFLYAHGGLFKVEGVGQKILENALETPVTVSGSAGEGDAWHFLQLMQRKVKQNLSENGLIQMFFLISEKQPLILKKMTEESKKHIKNYKAGLKAERILEEVE